MKFCCYTPYSNKKRICTICKKKLIKNTKKDLFSILPQDIIHYIFLFYLKTKYMYYYSNLSLVSNVFHYNFDILYKSLPCIPYNEMKKFKKTIYYVTSKTYNIKCAKLYFSDGRTTFNLLFGEENMLLSTHKFNNINNKLDIYYLSYFDFIII